MHEPWLIGDWLLYQAGNLAKRHPFKYLNIENQIMFKYVRVRIAQIRKRIKILINV